MTFTTIPLTNERVLVKGTDIAGTADETIVSSAQWNELKVRDDVRRAQEDFDATVDEFFAPLLEAAEKAKGAVDKPRDPLGYVVITEGQEGRPAVREHVVTLTRDSIILRLIEQGNTDRLIWVNGELEVTEAAVQSTPSAPAPAETEGPGADFVGSDEPAQG